MPSSDHSDRVVVWLKPDYIGDAVWALPLVDACIHAYGPIHVCGGNHLRPVFRGRTATWISGPHRRHGYVSWSWALRLRRMPIGTAILANRSFRSAFMAKLSGAKRRVGHDVEGRGTLLTHRVPYDWNRNEGESLLDLAAALDIPAKARWPQIDHGEHGRNGIVVQPGARHGWKRPPWRALIDALTRSEATDKISLVGGSSECEDCSRFLKLLPRTATDLCGHQTLTETMAVLARAELFVAGDTGLVHLAAALGTPTLAFLTPKLSPKWSWKRPGHGTLPPDASVDEVSEALESLLPAFVAP